MWRPWLPGRVLFALMWLAAVALTVAAYGLWLRPASSSEPSPPPPVFFPSTVARYV